MGEHSLSARLFYGIIVGGFLTGLLLSCLGGWFYLQSNTKPSGRGIWDEVASTFVIPVSAIIGATFGGLAGVALAVGLSVHRRRDQATPSTRSHSD